MKKDYLTWIFAVIAIAGLSLFSYPLIANWWNEKVFNEDIRVYTSEINHVDTSEIDNLLAEADRYNEAHSLQGNTFKELTGSRLEEYNRQLSLNGSDMMGYLSIPKISAVLPIFHGVDESVLSSGIGHISGTSLPTGGTGTHSVLSGHRGLPSAKLLSYLDQVVEGDDFTIEIYGKTLTYEVDQIRIVLPEDLAELQISPGDDFCTLVTCTPYSVNTHRLLVRGHRVKNAQGEVRVVADCVQIEPIRVAPFLAVPVLVLLIIGLFVSDHFRKRRRKFSTWRE